MTSPIEPWRRRGPLGSAALRALSLLYRLGWACLRWWRRGRSVRVAAPVLSVGNLSVGGTGKSPLVRLLADHAARAGRSPAILLRGYGAKPGPRPLRVSRSDHPAPDPARAGDEAVEHARACAAPVWVDPDRARSAQAAVAAGADCLILDDGFQRRWQLARDLDLLLADFGDLERGGRLLPAGPWREPWSQAASADAVLVSGAPTGLQSDALRARLPAAWRGPALFRLDRAATGLEAWPGGATLPLENLRDLRVLALSGVGRPESFEALLETLGAAPTPWRFQDHHRFTVAELERPPRPARAIVTTAKDAVRLPAGWTPTVPVWILRVEAQISPAEPFWARVDVALASHPAARKP